MPPTAPSDPATAAVDPPVIRGEVMRVYPVHSVGDVDFFLRGLRQWLSVKIAQAPEWGMDYVRRYNLDVDRLLDERGRLMGLTVR